MHKEECCLRIKKVVLIVIDSVGIGALPDAHEYGDQWANTLGNIAKFIGGLKIPNLQKMGLANLLTITGVSPLPISEIIGAFGKMSELSKGKDTTTGHWEISGVVLEKPFPVYPNGFPEDLILLYEKKIGRKILGNKPASGTAIIEELGELHIETGFPIVYTSADSVFQVAAHEEVIPLHELYRYCEIARSLLQGEHAVGRVIARPFVGHPGSFQRTKNRRDFSLPPTGKTILDALTEKHIDVYAVGKIKDIFAGRGITEAVHTGSNMEGVDRTIELLKQKREGLIFTNLVDFDMVYGHRNDSHGYARALEEFDSRVPEILSNLGSESLLIITADHGCDPTTEGTDHTREYTPLLVGGAMVKEGVPLGIRETFADIAATLAEIWGIPNFTVGKSFLKEILKAEEIKDV